MLYLSLVFLVFDFLLLSHNIRVAQVTLIDLSGYDLLN